MIHVQVGDWKTEYIVGVTTAPRRYDGFGTIELYDGKTERVVAIQKEHLDWHQGRYGSGMYSLRLEEGQDIDRHYAEEMVKRLIGKEE